MTDDVTPEPDDGSLPTTKLEDAKRIMDEATARARERRDAEHDALIAEAKALDEAAGLIDMAGVKAEYETALKAEVKTFKAYEKSPTPENKTAWDLQCRIIETAGNRLRGVGSRQSQLRVKAEALLDEGSQSWHKLVREERDRIERTEASKASRHRKRAQEEKTQRDAKDARKRSSGKVVVSDSERFALRNPAGEIVKTSATSGSLSTWRSRNVPTNERKRWDIIDRGAAS